MSAPRTSHAHSRYERVARPGEFGSSAAASLPIRGSIHGGLSPDLTSPDELKRVQRPVDVPDTGLLCDTLWSDPDKDIMGWAENDRGVSYTFGPDVVTRFLQRNDLDLIVRAHQVGRLHGGYRGGCMEVTRPTNWGHPALNGSRRPSPSAESEAGGGTEAQDVWLATAAAR